MKGSIGKKEAAVFIFCILISVILIPSTVAIDRENPLRYEQGDPTESICYTFSFNQPRAGTIETADATFSQVDIPGCIGLGRQPGDPTLPVKFIQLLLPPQATVDSVTVTGLPVEQTFPDIDLKKERIYPSQAKIPVGSVSSSEFVMNEEVYSSGELYPALLYREYNIGYAHGYAILNVALQPVQLIPNQGRLFYSPEMTVTIFLHEKEYQNPFFRGTPEDAAWVKNLVSNPEVAAQYADLPTFEYPGGLCDPSDHYDYVIVTTEQNSLDYWDISEYTPYNWESLIEKHTFDGLVSTLVTIQDINACSDYWNLTYYPLFNDTQAHIREFCKDAYQDWGANYILIGGDAEFIPARLMDNAGEYGVDSDIYWSNLDYSFNADHDNHWGEEGDDGFDASSELFLGRIPCDIPKDVSNWLTKSFYYTDAIDSDYLENGGFYATNLSGWPGSIEADDIIDFAAIKGTNHWLGPNPDQWPGWLGFLYGFETWNTLNPNNLFNLSVRWTYCDPNPGWIQGEAVGGFRNAINNNSVTLITGIGHANMDMSLDVYTSDWESLYHNTKPFFISDLGCHCGDIDDGDGVLDSMLFYSNTTLAFGCLYNSGYSWSGSFECTNSSDTLQTKLFWDYFFDIQNNSQSYLNWQLGKGQAWSKDIMAPTLNWDFTWRATLEDRLLFADPAQLLRPPHPNSPPEIPTLNWSPDFGLTVVTNDPETDEVYYMVDWGDDTITEWLGSYPSGVNATFTHTWSVPDSYIVKAKAKDIHDAVSDWSDPLLVEIPSSSLTIESIRGGLGITVILKNTGSKEVSNVKWTIGLNGGLILLGESNSGDINVLPAGESKTIKSFIIGLGKTSVTINATCAEGTSVEKTASVFVFGIFVVGLIEFYNSS